MKRHRWFTFLAVLAVAGLVLSACGGGATVEQTPGAPAAGETQEIPATGETPAPTQPQASGDKVTIRLATWAGVEESQELQAVIDKVNAEAASFQIVHEPAPDDYYTKIQTSLAGNAGPDLFWLSQEYIAGMADQGVLLDITDQLQADTTHPAADVDDYFPEIIKTARFNERYFGLPWVAQPVVLYYNKALFDAAGMEYPTPDWTWDDFEKAAADLTVDTNGDSKNDQWGFTLNGWPPPQMFVWQAGGEVITDDLSSSPIDTPEAIQAFDFYSSLIYDDEHTPPQSVLQEQGFGEMFKAGKIAMFMGGSADDLDRVEGLDVGVTAVPAGPATRATFAWTASTVVSSQTQNPDQAYEALVMLTEGIHHWKIVAPRQSLATAEVIAQSEPRKAQSAEAIAAAVPDMRAFTIIPRQQEWDTIFWGELMDPLMNHSGTAADLAPKVRPDLDSLLPTQ